MAGEGTGEGTGTGAGTGQEGLWRAQLPADLKDNEAFSAFKTLGDFGKAYLDTAGKVKELDGKAAKATEYEERLKTALFKPDDKATPEQREAFLRAIGKPEKANEYEFPKGTMEQNPKLMEWARAAFHEVGLSKDQGKAIAAKWDGLMAEMVKAETEAKDKAKADAETAIKKEFGDQYPVAAELTKRFLKEAATADEQKFLDDSGIGNNPILIRLIFKLAKKTGEDISPQGGQPGSGKPQEGFIYNKSPEPPK